MARFDEHDYASPPQWHSLAAQKRLDLSASVTEAMLDASKEEQESDEDGSMPLPSQDSMLIPPRLSLQSRPLPVVHPGMSTGYERVHVAEAVNVRPRPPLSRRTTKVRLQVVPAQPPVETLPAAPPAVPVYEAITNHGLPLTEEPAAGIVSSASTSSMPAGRASLPAMGTFERGQRDLAVPATCVTMSSVVVVVLTGDPGPVVVQYISLQPGVGFTAHLSAPAQNRTPFNYVIL